MYWFFRPEIYIFDALRIGNSDPAVASGVWQIFLKNHFADAAWCAVVFQIARMFREHGYPHQYSRILIALPFVSETLQATAWVPGTFDWLDLAIYATLLAIFSYREVLQMLQNKKHIFGVLAVAVFVGAVIGSAATPPPPAVYETGVFSIERKPDDIFAKPALSRIIRTPKTLAIVLRVPVSGEKVTEEQRQQGTMLYNTIDKELARAGYIVRDRTLFAKVLDQSNLDYTRIGQLTETDLILELVSFRTEIFPVSRYKDENGVDKQATLPVKFTGSSIEFKIVGVKDNDLIASYTFYNSPCAKGCTHRFSTTVPSSLNATGYNPAAEEVYKDFAARLIRQLVSAR